MDNKAIGYAELRSWLLGFFISILLIPASTYAQTLRTVTGTVIDETGEPLIGATVKVVGEPTGAFTDIDGHYTVKVPAAAKQLTFSVVWGNLGETGKTFYASSADDHWNFWFPNPAGCYFTTLNTKEGWWSGLHIDNLTVAGDIAGEMTYNMKTNQWTLPINLSGAASVTITVKGKGSLYNKETTDMGPAIEQDVAFGGNCESLTFGETGSDIPVALPAGETTLVLDLSNPLALKIGAGEAAPEPEVESRLYFSGVVNWDGFDDYISLYDESTLSYGGAHWIQSEWGYRAYLCKQLITKMMGAAVEGVFYWEPEAPNGYNNGYNLGCFDNDAPTVALDAFKNR